MSVKIDETGRRSIQVEVEVPGTPEELWQAIATGPGISAWFVPTDLDGRVGGAMVCHFGPGVDSAATIKAWDPPHLLAAESGGYAPGAPPLATEWTVEAQSGGTCTVRVVHSLFASTDEWDDQLEGTEAGWPTFFRVLTLYLERFSGQPSSSLSIMAMAQGDLRDTWEAMIESLGMTGVKNGERASSTGTGVPAFSGIVESLAPSADGYRMLVKLDEPSHGTAVFGTYNCGGGTMPAANIYLYGDDAAAVIARDEPLWRAWFAERYPAPSTATTAP